MQNNRKSAGFTLIELVVVTVIIGIMASLAVPYYLKTVEFSKASDAVAIGHLLSSSYRMYLVDNGGTGMSGTLTNTCNTYTCANVPAGVCKLVACNYVAKQDWNSGAYIYSLSTVNPAAESVAASVRRRTGVSPGTNNAPYSGWGYDFTTYGRCVQYPATTGTTAPPPCPNF